MPRKSQIFVALLPVGLAGVLLSAWVLAAGRGPSEWPVSSAAAATRCFGATRVTDYDTITTRTYRFGWPLRCLGYTQELARRVPSSSRLSTYDGCFASPESWPAAISSRHLPSTPIWPALIANTLVYTSALWLVLVTPLLAIPVSRRLRGRCPRCGYPNGASDRCTECGRPVPARRPARADP